MSNGADGRSAVFEPARGRGEAAGRRAAGGTAPKAARHCRRACAAVLALSVLSVEPAFAQDLPALSVADAAAGEADATIDFVVSLGASASGEVTVNYATSEGEAGTEDFTAESGTLTFPAGTSERTIGVSLVDDSLDELSETFDLTLSDPAGATIGDGVATGTIEDDDPQPKLDSKGFSGIYLVEGHGFEIFILLSEPSGRTVAIDYATAIWDRSPAEAGSDYIHVSGTLTLDPGETRGSIWIATADDEVYEGRERFLLIFTDLRGATFANPVYRLLDGEPVVSAGFHLLDNEPVPRVSIADAADLESAGEFAFPVTLSGPMEAPASMGYATADGTAVAGEDYTAANATLSFGSGETSKTVLIPIIDDGSAETAKETFSVNLSQTYLPLVIEVGDLRAIGTIQDDDSESRLFVADASAFEGDGSLSFAVTLGPQSGDPATVDYATADGTAIAGQDYAAATGTLTFAPGETRKTITVALLDDPAKEASETFSVSLSGAVGATLGDGIGTGTIRDTDEHPTMTIHGSAGPENGFLDFAVTLANPTGAEVAVDYTTDQTIVAFRPPAYPLADAGSDYTRQAGTLTFAPGETSKTIRIEVLEDRVYEPVEAMVVTLENPVNARFEPRVGSARCPWGGCFLIGCCDCGTILNDDAPGLSISDASAAEGASRLAFEVELGGPTDVPVSVSYATSDGTAVAGEDYEAASGSLTIAAGATRKTIRVAPLDDDREEPTETFVVTLSAPAGAALSDAEGTGTITDDDQSAFSVAGGSGVEGGAVEFVVTLAGSSSLTATVSYATRDGTAVAGEDYGAASGTLTFAPGETSRTVPVSLSDDAEDEVAETFSFALSAPVNATIATAAADGTIIDDDDPPAFSVAGGSGVEGVEGGAVEFGVTLAGSSSRSAAVSYATRDGTAVAGEDYGTAWGTLTFAPGETSRTVPVFLSDDAEDEVAETFSFALSAPVNATIATATADGTIIDDDDPPAFSVAGGAGVEGGAVEFGVTLAGSSSRSSAVSYATRDGTAVAGEDYGAAWGTLTFAPGETSRTVPVFLSDDAEDEVAETFSFALSAPVNATIATAAADGTIIDDDDPPAFSVAGGAGVEGGAVEFGVTLAGSSIRAATVSYATRDGTAVAGEDYGAASGTLTFAPGETSRTVPVPLLDDGLPEPAETFAVTLSSPTNATIATAAADGTIIDDDGAPQLSIAGAAGGEGDILDFAVTLAGSSDRAVNVSYATSDGTAVAGEDYLATRGVLTFPAGESRLTLSVPLVDDAVREPTETFAVTLSAAENAEIALDNAVGRIADDDDPPAFSVAGGSGVEGGAVEFGVTLAGSSSLTAAVSYATRDGTAVAGEDYVAASGTLTFAPGVAAMTVSVGLLVDGVDEADETFALQLGSPANATLAVGAATGTIEDVDGPPMLSVADGEGAEGDTVWLAVTLSKSGGRRATVAYSTRDGTALAGSDYRAASGTLAFAPGETSRTVPVALLDDALEEPVETFALVLSAAANALLGEDAATVSIIDDAAAGRIVLAASPARLSEGDGPSPVAVTASMEGGPRPVATSVAVTVTGSGDPEAVGFAPVADFVIGIPAGAASGSGTFTLRPEDDRTAEADETLTVSGVSDLPVAPASVALADDDGTTHVVEAARARHVPLFESAADPARRGFLRVINRSAAPAQVWIEAVDDAGTRSAPLALALAGGAAAHLDSAELEAGGAPVSGDWRLELTSDLDIGVLAYSRTSDGFVTAVHDTAPAAEGTHRVWFFSPGGDPQRTSLLRLVNAGAADAEATVAGVDDAGTVSGELRVAVRAGTAVTLSAAELESGVGAGIESGALGDGEGAWRLTVASPAPLAVQSLLAGPAGYLSNLSTSPGTPGAAAGSHAVPLFPSMAEAGLEGLVRVVNRSAEAGAVRIVATDDAGREHEPVTLPLPGGGAAHFDSADLELGNAEKGLAGSTGAGEGSWRLDLTSELEIEVLSYARTTDGFLTSMHDVAPERDGARRVEFFNPAGDARRESRLRLVNAGSAAAAATVTGVDDAGRSPGGAVRVRIAAGTALELTSSELETGSGEGIEGGALGDGEGRWRLRVESDAPVLVMSLLASPTGHLADLSTAPTAPADAPDPADAPAGAVAE